MFILCVLDPTNPHYLLRAAFCALREPAPMPITANAAATDDDRRYKVTPIFAALPGRNLPHPSIGTGGIIDIASIRIIELRRGKTDHAGKNGRRPTSAWGGADVCWLLTSR